VQTRTGDQTTTRIVSSNEKVAKIRITIRTVTRRIISQARIRRGTVHSGQNRWHSRYSRVSGIGIASPVMTKRISPVFHPDAVIEASNTQYRTRTNCNQRLRTRLQVVTDQDQTKQTARP
jgi:hypothetical protein